MASPTTRLEPATATARTLLPNPGSEVEVVDPLLSPGWDAWVSRHPGATVFHRSAWCRTLVDAYGFTPLYLIRKDEGSPVAAWPLMEVGGTLRGRRGASLPFTDHCPPLLPTPQPTGTADVPGDLGDVALREPLLAKAFDLGRQRRWHSLELREAATWTREDRASVRFFGHTIDLAEGEAAALHRCDSAVRRSIRKAEASGLRAVHGQDSHAIRAYARLHALTRRRHGLPPQPYPFFSALQRHVLSPGLGTVLLVLKDQTPIAGAVFLFSGPQAIYKFGASDETHQALRPNNLVFREAIRLCARQGATSLDLGRTSLANEGLRRFKRGWGSSERMVSYLRYDLRTRQTIPTPDRASGWHTLLFQHMPQPLASLIGRFVYRLAA
ncbi:MAG: GNAT family N-acetyltransferase [Verrucomicrobiae bacterium]|nr:GNAT family N-acetyltransferase [Verrucomicrobiae bacterium]